eukprot:5459111-Prorocentrum_lima.AAC.1
MLLSTAQLVRGHGPATPWARAAQHPIRRRVPEWVSSSAAHGGRGAGAAADETTGPLLAQCGLANEAADEPKDRSRPQSRGMGGGSMVQRPPGEQAALVRGGARALPLRVLCHVIYTAGHGEHCVGSA